MFIRSFLVFIRLFEGVHVPSLDNFSYILDLILSTGYDFIIPVKYEGWHKKTTIIASNITQIR